MTTFGDDVAGHARDLLLSHWAELGIEPAPRRHDWQALDLEPLIVFTACCADASLRARTLDWCAENQRLVSTVRLHRFSWVFGQSSRQAYRRYAEAVTNGAKASPASKPRRRRSTGGPDLRRPALVQLRLRALAGASARAEVLKLLLAEPREERTAASLVGPAGYGKGGLAQALESLTLAGFTSAHTDGPRTLYRLNRPMELAQTLSGVPARFPDWAAIFRVVEAILRYAACTADGSVPQVAAAAATVQSLREIMPRIDDAPRPPRVMDAASVDEFERWALDFVAGQAGATPMRSRAREVTYTVHRLLLGGWIATVKEEGDEPRPLALSDDPELHPERRARRRLKLDELGAAAEVVESILYDIRARELQRTHGSVVSRRAVSDSLLPAMSREFAAELLQPMHKGQAATFTEEFLQRWSGNRRERFSAAG